MPSFCCVLGCSSDGTFQKGLAFHEFPTEKSLRKSWIHAIRRDVGPTFKLYGDRRRFAPLTFAKKIIGSHVPERWLVENRSRKMGQTAWSPRRTAISWLLAWFLVCFQASLSDQQRGRDHHRESGRNLPLLLRILLTTRTVRVLIWLILSNLVMT